MRTPNVKNHRRRDDSFGDQFTEIVSGAGGFEIEAGRDLRRLDDRVIRK